MEFMRNMLIMPGNNPSMLLKSTCFNADAIVFDLEDAVHPAEKDAATRLVVKTINSLDFSGSNVFIRINNDNDETLVRDIKAVANLKITGICIPKTEDAQIIHRVIALLDEYTDGGENNFMLVPTVESAKSALHVEEMVGARPDRLAGVVFGAGDYCGSLGATMTVGGEELQFARAMMVNACAMFNVPAIDSPMFDMEDMDRLKVDAARAKNMGYRGKIAINPRQIEGINEVFTPTKEEIMWSKRIIKALETSESGVLSVDGTMIDVALTKRAESILAIAKKVGVIK